MESAENKVDWFVEMVPHPPDEVHDARAAAPRDDHEAHGRFDNEGLLDGLPGDGPSHPQPAAK